MTAGRIENSTTNDVSWFFVAAGCVRCIDRSENSGSLATSGMNGVNKKCTLEPREEQI